MVTRREENDSKKEKESKQMKDGKELSERTKIEEFWYKVRCERGKSNGGGRCNEGKK